MFRLSFMFSPQPAFCGWGVILYVYYSQPVFCGWGVFLYFTQGFFPQPVFCGWGVFFCFTWGCPRLPRGMRLPRGISFFLSHCGRMLSHRGEDYLPHTASHAGCSMVRWFRSLRNMLWRFPRLLLAQPVHGRHVVSKHFCVRVRTCVRSQPLRDLQHIEG